VARKRQEAEAEKTVKDFLASYKRQNKLYGGREPSQGFMGRDRSRTKRGWGSIPR